MHAAVCASTRPELIKLAPVMNELKNQGAKVTFIATGQHYDLELFQQFIEDLDLPKPDFNLEVGSGSQAYQLAESLIRLEKTIEKIKPNVMIVEGDTNSTTAGALAATKLHIPCAHVEAGLRSFDKNMPEEVNRILVDHISEFLFAPTEIAALNLVNETIDPPKIFVTGNTIVDAVKQYIKKADSSNILTKLNLIGKNYIAVTVHRAESVDDPIRLKNIVKALVSLNKFLIVFPVHPRTEERLNKFGLKKQLENANHVKLTKPL
ncbi:MAG: UDP-N-acetylglucosamine 2-epimerase (non-hydrolyzing), partial [Euryarchaeota archaeon]|nr:UDP-N-acetylglucosamine 2-epimerase (non-hydrolyzing) [Euryarchaeota archaeon]